MAGKRPTEGTAARRIEILRLLAAARSEPNGLSVAQIVERLPNNRFPVNTRTVQRDLSALSDETSEWAKAGIHIEGSPDPERQNALLWRHTAKSKALLFRTMTQEEATMLTLLKQELELLLPSSVSTSMSHYFVEAERLLSINGKRQGRQFKDRVRVIADSVQQIAPQIQVEHLNVISEALLHEEKIHVKYSAANRKNEPREVRLHPIGLLKKGLFYYVLAKTDESIRARKPPSAYRVDRFLSVKRRQGDEISRELPSFDQALSEGAAQFLSKGLIKLRLYLANVERADITLTKFMDAPLSTDQKIVENPDGSHILTATVHNTIALTRLLQGLSHHIDVIEPVDLRDEIDRYLEDAVRLRQRRHSA